MKTALVVGPETRTPRWFERIVGILALTLAAAVALPTHAARKALVIGNDTYEAVDKLRNARTDADAMAAALRKAGYAVTLEKDLSLRQMKDKVRSFRASVGGGDEVVFFFAGHGVQIGGMNYLLPVDVRAQTEDQVRDDAIALGDLLADIGRQKPALTLAIVDACRDNPFPKKGRAIGGRGLTGVAGATGQMVIYSAGEGQQALDRLGENDPVRNGVFTRVFVRAMETPGVTINDVVREVREQVHRLAQGQQHEQVPAIYDQVLGRFYFYAPNSTIVVNAPPAAAAAPAPASDPTALELAFWNTIKDSKDAQEFAAYLEQYPSGQFAPLAKVKQRQLQTPSQQPSQAGGPASVSTVTTSNDRMKVCQQAAAEAQKVGDDRKNFMSNCLKQAQLQTASQQSAQASGTSPVPARQSATTVPSGSPGSTPGTVFRDCADCPELVVIPPGRFQMGSPGTEEGRYDPEGPAHEVRVGGFALGKYEVTRREYTAFVRATARSDGDGCLAFESGKWEKHPARNWRDPGFTQTDQHPAVCVNWEDAQAFAIWLAQKTGKGYRLASESEWEYAARAGTTSARYWGERPDDACRYANVGDRTTKAQVPGWTLPTHACDDGAAYTAAAGRYQPNAFGLYDMLGNAWEWVQDCLNENYAGTPTDGRAWSSGDCSRRVVRGGSWGGSPRNVRSAHRDRVESRSRNNYLGFRVARTLP